MSTAPLTKEVAKARTTSSSAHDNPSGCYLCQDKNLEQLFATDLREDAYPPWADSLFGADSLFHESDCRCLCPLCILMRDIMPTGRTWTTPGHRLGPSYKHFLHPEALNTWPQLASFNGPRWISLDDPPQDRDNTLYGYVSEYGPRGCIGVARPLHAHEQGVEVRRIFPRIRSLSLIKDWLVECNKTHISCKAIGGNPVPKMMLIDCRTREIVAATQGTRYAALSYVWGTCHSSHCEEALRNLPKDVPSTIADAIEVTLALNLHYLWVDRYCIPQDDEERRAEQISCMHRIYERSAVTIVDAAGSDPDYGLSGVSRDRIVLQKVYGDYVYPVVDILPAPIDVISTSPWNTRGWTFQEGEMSTRILFFTEEQVYFQCREYSCCECFDPVHSHGLTKDQQSAVRVGRFNADSWNRDIWIEILSFTSRKLGRSDDVLNAMLGVLERYQEKDDGYTHAPAGSTARQFKHLSGLPLIRTNRKLDDDTMKPDCSWERQIIVALRWQLWLDYGNLLRRTGFPSWCWTGWIGRVDAGWVNTDIITEPDQCHIGNQMSRRVVSVEDSFGNLLVLGGNDLDLKIGREYNTSKLRTQARFLSIESAVFHLQVSFNISRKRWVLTPPRGEPEDQHELYAHELPFFELFQQSLASNGSQPETRLVGLVLGTYSPDSTTGHVPVLLLRGCSPMERLDIVALPQWFMNRTNAQLRTIKLG